MWTLQSITVDKSCCVFNCYPICIFVWFCGDVAKLPKMLKTYPNLSEDFLYCRKRVSCLLWEVWQNVDFLSKFRMWFCRRLGQHEIILLRFTLTSRSTKNTVFHFRSGICVLISHAGTPMYIPESRLVLKPLYRIHNPCTIFKPLYRDQNH